MREILYRGKRVDNGEWVEGDLLRSRGKCYIHEHIDPFDYLGELSGFIKMYEVAPETVSEFTGLTDKNGKKIFEGDIVKWTDEYFNDYKSEVIYHCDKYNYPAFDFEKHDYECNGLQYAHEDCYLEVIGNIHDNPELLEEDEE